MSELRSAAAHCNLVTGTIQLVSWLGDGASIAERRKRILNNLSSFLTDLGFPGLRLRHQAIRYLHSRVLEPHEGHNPVIHDIAVASDAVSSFLADRQVQAGALPEARVLRFGADQYRLQERIDSAIHASALLESIATAVRQLFGFHPLVTSGSQRYMGKEFGFSHEVKSLRELLQRIRTDGAASWSDSNQLNMLFGPIASDLTLQESELIQALLWYIVPFKTVFSQILTAVDEELGAFHGRLWEDSAAQLPRLPEVYVLCEPPLLREILRNVLLNAKHVYPKGGGQWRSVGRATWSYGLDIGSDPTYIAETVDYLRLTVSTPQAGRPLFRIPEGTTLDAHARSVAAYGGA